MSLHAQLSPETRHRLQSQRRRSSIASVVISLLTITLVVLVLAFFFLELPAKNTAAVTIVRGDAPEEPPTDPRTVSLTKKPTRPPGGMKNPVLVSRNQSDLAIPVPDTVLATPSEAFGSGEGFDSGPGDPFGEPGGPGIRLAPPLSKRCSQADRLRRLKEAGGTAEIDEAVVKALRQLKETQAPDGSWGSSHKVGMTGLALLAYLGRCETPVSAEFGQSCFDALAYLLDIAAKNNGKLATNLQDKHWPYEHAIATYALAEALSFGRAFSYNIPGHERAVRDGGQWIIDNQHPSGGWDYSFDESSGRGGDLSIVGWQLQALKACKVSGVELRNLTATVRRGLEYVEARQATSGGFGYTGTTPVGGLDVHSLTGVGVLSFQLWGKDAHSAARKGVRYLSDHATLDYKGSHSDLYAHYYHSQALLQHGGKAWEEYNADFAPQLQKAQQADGSFAPPGGGNKVAAVGGLFAQNTPEGIHYRTCLCALMLEVYYRYLPGTS